MTYLSPRWCWPILLALFGLAGCGTTTWQGDATLHTERALIGPEGHRTWWLELPKVSLTEEGVHRFRIRGLPRLAFGFELLMYVAESEQHEQDITSSPWRETQVTVTVLSPQGETLGQSALRLGELFSRNGFGASIGEDLPVISAAVPHVSDFDVVVGVERPSPRAGDRMQIVASTSTNDRNRINKMNQISITPTAALLQRNGPG